MWLWEWKWDAGTVAPGGIASAKVPFKAPGDVYAYVGDSPDNLWPIDDLKYEERPCVSAA